MKEKEYYWSNCLIEALVAKLSDWKNTRIIFVPAGRNSYNNCSHFVWLDIKNETIKDFYCEEEDEVFLHWWDFLWWKGYIRELDYRTWVRWSSFGRRDI